MKLRKTLARSSSNRAKKPNNKAKISKQQRDASCSDSENDVSFEEIAPFSPLSNENNLTDEENFSSDTAAIDSNEELFPENGPSELSDTRGSSKPTQRLSGSNQRSRKVKQGKSTKSSSKVPKTQSKKNTSLLADKSINELDLELLIDDAQITTFKEILQQLPQHFADEYCRYLLALQEKYRTPSSGKNSKTRNAEVHCSKSSISSSKTCVICGKKFRSSKELNKHILTKHESPDGYHCNPCDKLFKTVGLFNHHVNYFHSTSHTCPYCNLCVQDYLQLNKHLSSAHASEKRFLCTLCNKGFCKGFQLMMHINVHTGLTPHKCEHCPKAYSTNDSLKEHLRRHKNESLQFKCDKCEKTFHTQKLLNVHALTHGEERRFKCNLCEKAFKTSQNLNHHRSYCKSKTSGSSSEGKGAKKTRKKDLVKFDAVDLNEAVKDLKNESVENSCVGLNVNSVIEKKLTSLADKRNTEAELNSTEINSQPLNLDRTLYDETMGSDSEDDE